MSESGKKRKSRFRKLKRTVVDFSNRVGLSPVRILLGLLLACCVGGLLVWVGMQGRTSDDSSSSDRVLNQDQQELLDIRLRKIITELGEIGASNMAGKEPILRIEDMRSRLKALEKIEQENQLSPEQLDEISEIKIKAEALIVIESVDNGYECESTRQALVARCRKLSLSDNKELAERAMFTPVIVEFMDFRALPDETSFASFTSLMNENAEGLINNIEHTAVLTSFADQFCKENKGGAFNERLYVAIAELLSQSPRDEIRRRGEMVGESSKFLDFDLFSLARRVAAAHPFAADDLEGSLGALAENPGSKPETYFAVLRAYEGYFGLDKIEQAGKNWQKMYRIVDALEDSSKKQLLQASLKRQRMRAESIGKPFEVNGKDAATGAPFEVGQSHYTLIAFVDRQPESLQMLRDLGKASRSFPGNLVSIVAFAEKMTVADYNSLDNIPSAITVTAPETTKRYLEEFATDFFPYSILVGRDGNIAYINVQLSQIENRIATLETKRRSAARQE